MHREARCEYLPRLDQALDTHPGPFLRTSLHPNNALIDSHDPYSIDLLSCAAAATLTPLQRRFGATLCSGTADFNAPPTQRRRPTKAQRRLAESLQISCGMTATSGDSSVPTEVGLWRKMTDKVLVPFAAADTLRNYRGA